MDELDDWEILREVRPREPANTHTEKCDACWDMARFVCEVPRSRRIGSREVEDPPARFRLCSYHTAKLLGADEKATAHVIGGTLSGD